jgi:flagellar protein FlaG
MDIGLGKALAPASVVLPSTKASGKAAATESSGSAAASPIPDSGAQDVRVQRDAMASQLEAFLNSSQRDIEFRVDADTHAQVVTVRDGVSGEVIRQMPNEDVLRVLKNLSGKQGTLLNEAV